MYFGGGRITVVGASILVKGTTVGTVTDMDGKFTLSNVPSSAKTLVVSFIGMASQEVSIKQNVSIILKSDTKVLGEVMVVGIWHCKKGIFTGSASVINNKKLELRPISNVTKDWKDRLQVC
ncbi:carboxypeptidase-like regulatory domain-containing protein [Phocaeicola vulgatus]|uniref:carboxypeptidase-like regulatory domain-containing protein n=1 Tax=Phocaeicola vulgatus TaxID=821 RepID=UPI003C6DD85F